MRKLSILLCLVLLAGSQLWGQLTVYPGDANDNHTANHVDLLYLGLQFGNTGPARNVFPNTTWTPQPAAPWGGPAQVDPAFSDCDGDGTVSRGDAAAIDLNFGQIHSGAFLPDPSSIGNPNSPLLRVNLIQDSIFVQGVTQLTLAIELGTPGLPLDSIYGYAVTLEYDTLIVDNISFNFASNSLIDSSGMQIARVDTNLGKIFFAATNTDHMNRQGSGTIATIGIVMDDDIRIAGLWNLILTPSEYVGFTASGSLVPAYPQADTLVITTGRQAPVLEGIDVFPNPTDHLLFVRSATHKMESIRLLDMQGHVVANVDTKGFEESMDLGRLAAGCYLLEVQANQSSFRKMILLNSH